MNAALRHRLDRIIRRLDVRGLSPEMATELRLRGVIGECDLSDAQLEAVANSSNFDWRDFTDAELEEIASGRRSPQDCIRRRQRRATSR